ncbi:MAG: PsiF family protein [Betaproteobacteria bacterium]
MKKMLALAIIGAFAAVGGSAFAADPPAPAAPANAQQQRMKDCNAKATDKKGDERKTFMSACLAGKDTAGAKMTQQEKMKACNAKATDKKGDERKAFMSNCLKAAPPA